MPLLATAIGGFKELGELRTNPFGLPLVWQWQNYWGILSSDRYWHILGNSLFISSLTVALTLAVAAPAAFAFAHLHFFGQRFLFNYLILGLTFPFATAILPLFIKVRDLGLLDTHWGIILPQVAFSQALSILLMRNAFRQVPPSFSIPRSSTAAAICASSSGSRCRFRARSWRPSRSSASW